MNQTSEKVRELYERFPYPPREPQESLDPYLDYIMSFTGLKRDHAPTFLDAGCGTGSCALGAAVLHGNVQVFACDFNQAGLDAIQDDIDSMELPNIGVHKLDLLNIPEDFGPERGFDVIYCMGVIHHTPDPAGILKSLAARLAPQGVLRLMVYAQTGRHDLYRFARIAKALHGDKKVAYEDRIVAAKSLMTELEGVTAKQGFAVPTLRGILSDSNAVSIEEFADRYLHPHDVPYTLNTLREHIEGAGLRFFRWFESRHWDLKELLPEAYGRGDFPEDQWEQYSIVEDLFDRDQYDCYVVGPDFVPNDGPLTWDCPIKLNPQVHFTEVSYRGFGMEHRARLLFYPEEQISPIQAKILKAVSREGQTLSALLEDWNQPKQEHILKEARWLLERDLLFRLRPS